LLLTEQKVTLFKHQQQMLEEACENCHKVLESDLSSFLDEESPDRSPFYKFRGNLINLSEALKTQR